MNIHLWNFVKVIRKLRIAPPHDVIHDDAIDLNTRNLGASINYGSQYVNSASWADNGEVAPRTQYIGQSRRGAHQDVLPLSALPAMRVHVHDCRAGVSIDQDVL